MNNLPLVLSANKGVFDDLKLRWKGSKKKYFYNDVLWMDNDLLLLYICTSKKSIEMSQFSVSRAQMVQLLWVLCPSLLLNLNLFGSSVGAEHPLHERLGVGI